MVSVPARATPVLAPAMKLTVPLPVPDAPAVTVSHGAFAAAVHVQVPADAVTATDPEPPVSATFWLVGAIVNVHGGGGGGGAACDTVKVCPPIVSVPLRAVPVFAATVNATEPLPVPDDPPVIVNHGTLAPAVHPHEPADAVTVTEPGPPVSPTVWAVGAIEIVQGAGAAACVMLNVRPAATIDPVRGVVAVFAATVNATVPLPVPELPVPMLIQAAVVVAVHAQLFAEAVTAIDPGPPLSPTFCDEGEMENVQAGGGAAAWLTLKVLPAAVMVAVLAAPVLAATR
jgi:hypothetical protein